jgi:hypothetical protein
VEAPAHEGIRIEVLGPTGSALTSDTILAVAGLIGSQDVSPATSTTPMTLVIPLDPRVNKALALRSMLPLRLRIETVGLAPTPVKIKIRRAYLRTEE